MDSLADSCYCKCCLQQILAMAEIREDVEQHLRRIEGQRQLLTEQKVAEQRRLVRLLDAQLREACASCSAQEHELKDLLAEVLGQLHAYTGASPFTCLMYGVHGPHCPCKSSNLTQEPKLHAADGVSSSSLMCREGLGVIAATPRPPVNCLFEM